MLSHTAYAKTAVMQKQYMW